MSPSGGNSREPPGQPATGRAPVALPRAHLIAAILIASLITVFQVAKREPTMPLADAHGYASIAYDIHRFGIFTDGSEVKPWPPAEPRHGTFVGPLYPALVAGLIALEPSAADALECVLVHREKAVEAGCPTVFGLIVPGQTVLAIVSAVLVFAAAWIVCRSLPCAWLAMLLALATGEYAYYARQFLTENLTFPLITAASILMVLAWRREAPLLALAAGVALGLAALVRPSFAYLAYATAAAAAIALPLARGTRPSRATAMVLALAFGYAAAVAPWIVRNWVEFGIADITSGYSGHTLAQRVAYNAMTWPEWLVAFVYWLPDFGDSLATALFDEHLYRRLSFDHPESFYRHAATTLYREALAAAGSPGALAGYLIDTHVLADPMKHLAVTLALAWRGVWVAKYWGLVTVACFVPAAVVAVRRRWWEFLVLAFPAWFMLGFHAFVSVNVVRYNLILIPCLATAAGWVLTNASRRLAKREY